MKKFLIFITACFTLFGILGCSYADSPANETKTIPMYVFTEYENQALVLIPYNNNVKSGNIYRQTGLGTGTYYSINNKNEAFKVLTCKVIQNSYSEKSTGELFYNNTEQKYDFKSSANYTSLPTTCELYKAKFWVSINPDPQPGETIYEDEDDLAFFFFTENGNLSMSRPKSQAFNCRLTTLTYEICTGDIWYANSDVPESELIQRHYWGKATFNGNTVYFVDDWIE